MMNMAAPGFHIPGIMLIVIQNCEPEIRIQHWFHHEYDVSGFHIPENTYIFYAKLQIQDLVACFTMDMAAPGFQIPENACSI